VIESWFLCDSACNLAYGAFLEMRPDPPTSTLFPYTTLFRSTSLRDSFQTLLMATVNWDGEPEASYTPYLFAEGRFYIFVSGLSRDRKSTRLNSSHVKISYAVFCLKKKKRYENDKQRCIHSDH